MTTINNAELYRVRGTELTIGILVSPPITTGLYLVLFLFDKVIGDFLAQPERIDRHIAR
jgi:hypothetical protein